MTYSCLKVSALRHLFTNLQISFVFSFFCGLEEGCYFLERMKHSCLSSGHWGITQQVPSVVFHSDLPGPEMNGLPSTLPRRSRSVSVKCFQVVATQGASLPDKTQRWEKQCFILHQNTFCATNYASSFIYERLKTDYWQVEKESWSLLYLYLT